MQKLIVLALLVLVAYAIPQPPKPKAGETLWGLLVAGSNGYFNYRHQADVCHSYHVLRNHGIADENIVVMMYDDIAHNSQNPTPGQIINHPNGQDVYAGVPKDYTGKDVTPENFLKILQGQKPMGGSGKVINSGPNDHVFVYYSDHGATGLVAFPNGKILTVSALNKALKDMYDKKQYGQLVFYLESCEAGSMFRNVLPTNINIYATTAADYNESSYACYYDSKRGTYLGDHYSVNWMEDSDKVNIETETLEAQFQLVKKLTDDSHCQEYGQMDISTEVVGEFQGETNPAEKITYPKVPKDTVESTEVPLMILQKRLAAETNEAIKIDIMHQIKQMLVKRQFVESVVDQIVFRLTNEAKMSDKSVKLSKLELHQFDCHEAVATAFHDICFNLSDNPYAMKFVRYFANMCEFGIPAEKMISEMKQACNHGAVQGVN